MPLALLALVAACSSTASPTALAHREVVPPLGLDTDGDEVPDAVDGCPKDAEDFDLHADADGCPDLDDDRDGVPDEQDPCFDLPGTDGFGCPEGCTYVTDIVDCFFITAVVDGKTTVVDLKAVKKTFDDYPEIRTVTLSTSIATGQDPALADQRLERARKLLIAAGVPGGKLALSKDLMVRDQPSEDVWGMITKQRFESGKFRTTHCADPFGAVYRPDRTVNYSCRKVVCGDGVCYRSTEDDTCPRDCPR